MELFAAMGLQVVQVLVAGLILGAGLPAVFALGLRWWSPAIAGSGFGAAPRGRRIAAVLCFAMVGAAISIGIGYLVVSGHR